VSRISGPGHASTPGARVSNARREWSATGFRHGVLECFKTVSANRKWGSICRLVTGNEGTFIRSEYTGVAIASKILLGKRFPMRRHSQVEKHDAIVYVRMNVAVGFWETDFIK
jgi:hypothetical protein